MTSLDRRRFLALCAGAGAGLVAVTTLPHAVRRALAARAERIVRNEWPEHWETPLDVLGRDWLTPSERFFVRSHFPVPELDGETYRLEVSGRVATPLSLSLADLRAWPQSQITCVLECAGNGRGRFDLANTSGTQWDTGAVGNAVWEGVKLSRILERAGVQTEAQHVWFEAADHAPYPQTPTFVRSIPLDKAMGDVVLATSMNDTPLSPRHGAPARIIVPGWYGMASTKWVTRIRLEPEPSDNHFMVRGYRYAYADADPAQPAPPVDELRIKSVITRPMDGDKVPVGTVRFEGFAWAGAEGVRFVEVTTDGGKTWRYAGFMGDHEPYSWRQWATEVEVKNPARLTVMARATDGRGAAQPLEAKPNAGGYGNNSIHQVAFRVA
jgi:DMSO/TMAO reductase YedYZ molybdopterin-dependent catalytic subunit